MAQAQCIQPGLGSGIYSYSEAARLLKVDPRRVSRWAGGYVAHRRGRIICKPPVLQSDSAREGVLTFQDLIELRFVKFYLDEGVRIATVAAAADKLAEELNYPYPFACMRLMTDGKQLLEQLGETTFRNAVDNQMVFDFVRSFFRDIDFDEETCSAERWYPMGREGLIVVDRHRSFGAPIVVADRGVRTDILYSTYEAEDGDAELVANWYGVSTDAVMAAVEFEREWRKAA